MDKCIATHTEDVQAVLQRVWRVIRKAVPGRRGSVRGQCDSLEEARVIRSAALWRAVGTAR